MMRRFLPFLLCAALLAVTSAIAGAQEEVDPCTTPNLLTKNCRFQRPVGGVSGFGVVYHDWSPYIVSGAPAFDANYHGNSYDPDDMVNGGREQSIYTTNNQPWRAGVYQRIENVKAGQAYYARIGWFVTTSNIQGRVGLDPNGGADPNSPAIVWSQPLILFRTTQHKVRGVYANGSVITVFVDATSNTPSPGGDRLWLTAVAVAPDPAYAPATPTPTETPRPTPTRIPTRTPTTVPPTATATATTTHTPTPTDTPTPSATPSPTHTPTLPPTATRRPTMTPTPTPTPALSLMSVGGVALGLAGVLGCSLASALALGGFAFWYWRRQQ